jgi:hypothetical protein
MVNNDDNDEERRKTDFWEKEVRPPVDDDGKPLTGKPQALRGDAKMAHDRIVVTVRLDAEGRRTLQHLSRLYSCLAEIVDDQPWNDQAKLGLQSVRWLTKRVRMQRRKA